MSRINAENPQESQGAHVPNHHSNFPMGNNQFITCRFGEYVPFFSFNSYEKDKVRQRNVTTTRSLSLKAPLMEDINLKRDYFQVYYDALLPINWDKCYVRPKRGDIVDWLQCTTNLSRFRSRVAHICNSVWSGHVSSEYTSSGDSLLAFLRSFTFLEMFYSDGSLLNHFGCHLSPCLRVTYRPDYDSPISTRVVTGFDKFFDAFCGALMRYVTLAGSSDPGPDNFILSFVPKGQSGAVRVNTASDLRFLLSLLREDGVSSLIVVGDVPDYVFDIAADATLSFVNPEGDFPFDLAPIWAYQMACAHFYSDDNVDYVFSAELFRSYIGNFINTILDSSGEVSQREFLYNGVKYNYDFLSAHFFYFLESELVNHAGDFSYTPYFLSLFGFNRSLRYQDYFAGARTAPIAVGDETEVSVDDNKVSVVDITRSIQWQRLLNNIQRLPQELGRFISASTGKNQSFDYHNPGWLAHTKDTVFAAEVENTGAAQVSQPNSVTATLRGKSSDKEFSFESDRPCIIIGIQYFDIRRAYYTGVKRVLQNESREDMFMPELQYIGDQPINNVELLSSLGVSPFGYTEQYNWLKQNYDEAMGGFVSGSLPGWAFLFKPDYWHPNLLEPFNISPSFIRSVCTELDEFFLSLTGYSLGTYFHFQQKVVNITSASRNMVRHSQILM